MPVSVELELVNGGTISIPVNSYQRRVKPELYCEYIRFTFRTAASWRVTGSGFDLYGETALEAMAPVCDGGTCVSFVEGENGAYDLSLGVYGTDAPKLPDELDIKVVLYDENGEEISSDANTVEFDDEVSAVFGNTITFGADPVGLDLSGKLTLLGRAGKKEKSETLAKGKFHGSFVRDANGELNLGGADKDTVSSSGSVVVAGKAAAIELAEDTDKDGVLNPPPLLGVRPIFGSESARIVRVRHGKGPKEHQIKER